MRTARGSRAPGESDKLPEPSGVCGRSNRPSSFILRAYRRPCLSHRFGCGVDSCFFALLDGDRRRSAGQGIEAHSRLGERDHVADGVRVGQENTNTVPAECDSAVGRSAVFERFEQEAEFFVCFAVGYPHQRENAFLHVEPVNTDRSAADLVCRLLLVKNKRQLERGMFITSIWLMWGGERMLDGSTCLGTH